MSEVNFELKSEGNKEKLDLKNDETSTSSSMSKPSGFDLEGQVKHRRNSIQERRKLSRGVTLDNLLSLSQKDRSNDEKKMQENNSTNSPKSPITKLLKSVSFHVRSPRRQSYSPLSSDHSPSSISPNKSEFSPIEPRSKLQIFSLPSITHRETSPVFNVSYRHSVAIGSTEEKKILQAKSSLKSKKVHSERSFRRGKKDNLDLLQNNGNLSESSLSPSPMTTPELTNFFYWDHKHQQNRDFFSMIKHDVFAPEDE